MASEFRSTRRIEFAETDMAGIIHFSNYFRYMEQAEHEFFRSLGLSIVERREDRQLTWPRVSASCDFLAPVHFEDVLDVQLRVDKKGRSSLTFAVVFTKDGTEVARGRLVTACCQMVQGKLEPIPIPDWISSKIEQAV